MAGKTSKFTTIQLKKIINLLLMNQILRNISKTWVNPSIFGRKKMLRKLKFVKTYWIP